MSSPFAARYGIVFPMQKTSLICLAGLLCGCSLFSPMHIRTGTYHLTGINDGGAEYSTDVLEGKGEKVELILNSDGTGTMYAYDDELTVAWDEDTITVDGIEESYEYEKGILRLVDDSSVLTFEKYKKK